MSVQAVRQALEAAGFSGTIRELEESSATVELAAAALGCQGARIAKTLSFLTAGGPVLIVAAGDARVDNHRFKEEFGEKARMIPADQVEALVGHAPGGVCPFALLPGVRTYLDESLRRFDTVFPAAGSSNSAVEMTLAQLESCCGGFVKWADLCRGWREAGQ